MYNFFIIKKAIQIQPVKEITHEYPSETRTFKMFTLALKSFRNAS